MPGMSAPCRFATEYRRIDVRKPGFGRAFLFVYFAALIERNTASLGQQSSFNPAFFW
jgi:hypothetical protein